MVDTQDLKSCDSNIVRVRVPLSAPTITILLWSLQSNLGGKYKMLNTIIYLELGLFLVLFLFGLAVGIERWARLPNILSALSLCISGTFFVGFFYGFSGYTILVAILFLCISAMFYLGYYQYPPRSKTKEGV